jgi:hypothetical protein
MSMSVSYRIDATPGVVFSPLQGRQLADDPAFRPTMHQCVEARGVQMEAWAAMHRDVAGASA